MGSGDHDDYDRSLGTPRGAAAFRDGNSRCKTRVRHAARMRGRRTLEEEVQMLHRGIALALLFPLGACSAASSAIGADESTTIDAYYRGALYRASYRELGAGSDTPGAQVSLLYQADAGLFGGAPFVSVLSATTSEPVWREVQLAGNQCPPGEICAVPAQLTSVEEILAAVGDGPDQIHLVTTDTRCSVLGVRPMSSTLQR
jgi:hypothetical protein